LKFIQVGLWLQRWLSMRSLSFEECGTPLPVKLFDQPSDNPAQVVVGDFDAVLGAEPQVVFHSPDEAFAIGPRGQAGLEPLEFRMQGLSNNHDFSG
jgi:hypothetical protein